MKTYLIDETPVTFLPTLAYSIGFQEAIVLQQIHYWVQRNAEDPTKAGTHFKDGHWWMFNSLDAWQKRLFFLSSSTLKRAIARLEAQNLLIVGHHSPDPRNRTKWYRINYEELAKTIAEAIKRLEQEREERDKNKDKNKNPLGQSDQMHNPPPLGQSDQMHNPPPLGQSDQMHNPDSREQDFTLDPPIKTVSSCDTASDPNTLPDAIRSSWPDANGQDDPMRTVKLARCERSGWPDDHYSQDLRSRGTDNHTNKNPEEPGSFASLTHAHTYTREEGPTPTIAIDRNPDPQQHLDPISIAKPEPSPTPGTTNTIAGSDPHSNLDPIAIARQDWTSLPRTPEEYQAALRARQEDRRNAIQIQENPISATETGLEGIGSIFQRPTESNSLKEATRALRMHGQVEMPSHLAVNPVSSIVGPTSNSMAETIVPPPPAASATKMPLEAIAPPSVPVAESTSLPEAVSGRILDEQIEMPIAIDPPKPKGGAKKAKAEEDKIELDAGTIERFKAVWNEMAPAGWSRIRIVDSAKDRIFTKLVKDFGGIEEAIEGFSDALEEASLDPWYRGNSLKLPNFASNGKIVSMAEACWDRRDRASQSSALVPEGGTIDAELVDDASAIVVAGSTSGSVAYQKTGNDPEGFAEFWGIWTAGMTALGRTAIGRGSARDAWIQMHGYACPEGLIDGARSYLRQELKRYQKDGRSFTYGAKRFIAEQVWVAALERDAIAQTLPAAMTEGREYELKKAAFWAESDRIYHEKYAHKEAQKVSA